MSKSVLIFDLDNTIYPVSSIAEKLFEKLFAVIEKSGEYDGDFEAVKLEIQRTPFQKVAGAFSFSEQLLKDCMEVHINLTYKDPMQYFPDYELVQKLPQTKFLVTSGFSKLQHSKIDNLGIRNDFEEIVILDLQETNDTKKDIFRRLLDKYQLPKEQVLIVGDDINSEIQAGKELGIDTVIYDRLEKYTDLNFANKIDNFAGLTKFL
ncbi:putative hydrolase of the HAD superfamily [Draconibacterium orientale]|uniref:Haloacid dehalogenase n=1 Tax=Draconibacterium orientale TaxID=1168034 RepID=X5E0X7_9BACT|nr:HAD family hydrolase [Draconibacterium orientale]AHW61135.1 haloacid dehalogenase [Draconibacterium orientale]SET34389.1 putative hydrolase of the HAD superfamily [Draconibacterium orientale]